MTLGVSAPPPILSPFPPSFLTPLCVSNNPFFRNWTKHHDKEKAATTAEGERDIGEVEVAHLLLGEPLVRSHWWVIAVATGVVMNKRFLICCLCRLNMISIEPSQLSACKAPAHQAQPLPGECKYPTLLVFPALTPRAVGTGRTMRGRLARREWEFLVVVDLWFG